MKIDEFAYAIGRTVGWARRLCRQGKIDGAERPGRAWILPENAPTQYRLSRMPPIDTEAFIAELMHRPAPHKSLSAAIRAGVPPAVAAEYRRAQQGQRMQARWRDPAARARLCAGQRAGWTPARRAAAAGRLRARHAAKVKVKVADDTAGDP